MFFRSFVFALILALLLTSQGQATEINREGADHLKSVFEKFIENQKTAFSASDKLQPAFEGYVSVEPSDTYYAVTLPFYKLKNSNGGHIDIGMISINAMPDESNPRQWKMTIAIPTPIISYDPEDNPLLRIDIGAQRAAGIFDENLEYFTKLDALYADITAQTADVKTFTLRIPETALRYDFTENDTEGLISGKGFMAVKNIIFQVASGEAKGKIGSLRTDFSLKKYDIESFNKNRKRIQALTKGMSTQGLDKKAHAKSLSEVLDNLYASFGDGMKFDYEIKDVEFTGKPKNAEDPAHQVKIGNVLFGTDIGGFKSGQAYLGLHFGYDGLSLPTEPQESEVTPTQARLALSIHNIPVKELTTIGQNTILGTMQNPDLAGMAMMTTMIKIPALLSQAGSYAVLDKNYIAGKDYRFDLDGKVQADMTALTNFTADIKGRFNGLDTLIERIQALSMTSSDKASRYQKILKQLQMLQMMGKKEEDSKVYTYDFTVSPQGQILMNGQDAKGLPF